MDIVLTRWCKWLGTVSAVMQCVEVACSQSYSAGEALPIGLWRRYHHAQRPATKQYNTGSCHYDELETKSRLSRSVAFTPFEHAMRDTSQPVLYVSCLTGVSLSSKQQPPEHFTSLFLCGPPPILNCRSRNASMAGYFDYTTEVARPKETQRSEAWLSGLEEKCHRLLDTFSGYVSPVRIAILDSGLDTTIPGIADKIGRANIIRDIVDFTQNDPLKTFPKGSDSVGHGTHTTSTLVRVAPRAAIYVGRVYQDTNNISAAIAATVRCILHVLDVRS
jgi:hypothetical protein